MHRRRAPRRAGFTLIELLVVIAIIAIVAAMSAAAVARVRAARQASETNLAVNKYQIALDQQWKAVVDRCMVDRTKGQIPPAIVNFCEGDLDRAHALWTYMNLRAQFPQTRTEATTGVTIGGYTLPAKKSFANVGSGGSADDQAAALLFIILTDNAAGGANSTADDSGTVETPAGRAFRDSYGNPISFRRFYQPAEIQQGKYVNNRSTVSKDPIDPLGKLRNWTNTANKTTAQTAIGVTFDGQNRMITAISVGPNKGFEDNPTGTTDDVFGYRVRQMDNQGD